MVKLFLEKFAHVLNIRPKMLTEGAEMYATDVKEAVGPLDACVRLID